MELLELEYDGLMVPFTAQGYVNLTVICARFGKRPAKFLELPSTREYIVALAARTSLPLNEVVSENRTALPDVTTQKPTSILVVVEGRYSDGRQQGTWAHPLLAIECARWCSPPFGVWCNMMVMDLMSGRITHPAMDISDKHRRRALMADKRLELAMQRDRFWRSQYVEGNSSTLTYLKLVGVKRSNKELPKLHLHLRWQSKYLNLPVGKVRQRRPDVWMRSGWQTVSTWAPELIHAELIRLGWMPAETPRPTAEALAAEEALTTRVNCRH